MENPVKNPTISKVEIIVNDSIFPDEFLITRLTNIPIECSSKIKFTLSQKFSGSGKIMSENIFQNKFFKFKSGFTICEAELLVVKISIKN